MGGLSRRIGHAQLTGRSQGKADTPRDLVLKKPSKVGEGHGRWEMVGDKDGPGPQKAG